MSTLFATTILLSSIGSPTISTAPSTASSTAAAFNDGMNSRGNALAAAIAVSALGMLIVGISIWTLFIAMRRYKRENDGSRIDLEQSANMGTSISGPLDLQKGGLRTLTLAPRTVVDVGATFVPPKQPSKNVSLRVLVLPELAKSRETSTTINLEEAPRSGRTQLPLATISKPLPSYQGSSPF